MDVARGEGAPREDELDVEAGDGERDEGEREGEEEGALERLARPAPDREVQARVGEQSVCAHCVRAEAQVSCVRRGRRCNLGEVMTSGEGRRRTEDIGWREAKELDGHLDRSCAVPGGRSRRAEGGSSRAGRSVVAP